MYVLVACVDCYDALWSGAAQMPWRCPDALALQQEDPAGPWSCRDKDPPPGPRRARMTLSPTRLHRVRRSMYVCMNVRKTHRQLLIDHDCTEWAPSQAAVDDAAPMPQIRPMTVTALAPFSFLHLTFSRLCELDRRRKMAMMLATTRLDRLSSHSADSRHRACSTGSKCVCVCVCARRVPERRCCRHQG